MKIHSIYLLPLLLFIYVESATASNKKNKKKTNVQEQIIGPISQDRACPPCPNFTCPSCVGGTGSTGPSGCTGPNCTGPCISPTGAVIPSGFACLIITQNGTTKSVNAGCSQVENLTVDLNVDVKEDLTVEDDMQVQNNNCITKNLTVGGDTNITGDEVVLGALTVNNGAVIDVSLIENGLQTINGSKTITGSHTVDQALSVGGTATFSHMLTASGGLSVFNGETLNGGLIISASGASINGDVCITGDEVLMGNLQVNNQLIVDQNATFNNVTVGPTGTLITNGPVIMNDGLTIASGSEIIKNGNLTIGTGTLTVNGTSLFQNQVNMNQGAMISGGLTVNGGSNIATGNLDVTTGNVTIAGSLTVNGPITSANGLSILPELLLTDTTNSLSPSSGTLVVNGGVGIGEDLWLNGSQFFTEVATEGGVPSGLDYYEESCFSTSFVWGGLTVNPPTSVLIRILRVGSVINLLIPAIVVNNPGLHIDVISSTTPLPARFRPATTIRGASSTIISNTPPLMGVLGEFSISPAGIITFGHTGNFISPQRITSTDFVIVDIDTITYNTACSGNKNCKLPM